MSKRFKSVIGVFLSLFLMTVLTTSVVFGDAAAEEAKKCPKTVKVLVEKVEKGNFQEYMDVTAGIRPWKTVDFNSPIAATIKTLNAAVGATVNKGDSIARLDDEPINKAIAEAEANVKKWKRILWQRENWKVRREASEKQAKGKLEEFEEVLASKQDELNALDIKAPITGRLDVLNAKEGDFISKDFLLGKMVQMDKVKIPLSNYMDNVNDGEKIVVTVKELSREVTGVVKKDGQGRAFMIIDNSANLQLHGKSAKFRVLKEEHKDVVTLPEGKIMKDGSGSFVYVVNGKRARKAALETGATEKGRVLITKGLNAGDLLISSEILDAKTGTTKDELNCLSDNKKIKPMAKDANGNLVKLKKGQIPAAVKPTPKKKVEKKPEPKKEAPKVVKEKPAVKKKPVVKKQPKPKKKKIGKPEPRLYPKFRVGLLMNYQKFSEENFENAYGRMVSLGFDISYLITDKIDLWLSAGTSSKTEVADYLGETDEQTFSYTPIHFDARYYISRSPKLDFFAGLGLSYFPFKEETPLYEVDEKAMGFNIMAGMYYNITKKISLHWAFRISSAKHTQIFEAFGETEEVDVKLGGMELLLGLSLNL